MDKTKKERFVVGSLEGKRFESNLDKSVKKSWGSLSMSRVPIDTRNDFINLAKDCFADDYGACLTHIFNQCAEYNVMKGKLIDLGSLTERINQLEYILREHIADEEVIEVKTSLDGSPINQKQRKVDK